MNRAWLWSLVAFLGLALLVRLGLTVFVDQPVFEFARTSTENAVVKVANVLTVIGQPEVSLILAVVLTVVLFRVRHAGWRGLAPIALLIAAFAVELVFKGIVGHQRPSREFYQDEAIIPSLLSVAGSAKGVAVGAGFPSGHVLRTAVLALLVAATWPRLRLPAIAVALVVAVTRLVLGDHWLSDVVGSGLAAVFLVAAWQAFTERRIGNPTPPLHGPETTTPA